MTEVRPPEDIEGMVEVTGAAMIKKLRHEVAPVGKRGTWMKHLSDARLTEIYVRLKKGQAPNMIARIVQDDWGMMRESSVKSLARAVRTFKDSVIGDLQIEQVASDEEKRLTRRQKEKAQRITKNVDTLGRLMWLIEVQTDRIQDQREREKKNMPFKQTTTDIRILSETLERTVRLQMELGLLDAKPSEHSVTVKHQFDKMMGAGQLQDDGAVLVSGMSSFLEMVAAESVLMTQNADGTFTPVEENGNGNDAAEVRNDALPAGSTVSCNGGEAAGDESP